MAAVDLGAMSMPRGTEGMHAWTAHGASGDVGLLSCVKVAFLCLVSAYIDVYATIAMENCKAESGRGRPGDSATVWSDQLK